MANSARLPFIRAISADLNGWGFFLCTHKDVRQGRTGELFVSLTLQDKTGLLKGRIFNEAARLRDEFDSGDFVKVQGRTDIFNGRVQLIIERIRRINPDQDTPQGFREEDCVLCAPRPVEEMWAELEMLIAHVQELSIRELLTRMTTTHREKLRIWPAAQTVHHAYRGGFLEHILSVARSALTLGTAYGANKDLLTAGALLHDIGKLEELDYDRSTTYSREGNLVGHVTLGVIMTRAAMNAIPDFPDVLRTQIEHMIVSHHGHKEFGAPVEPMTIEAMILSAADDLDAKINQVRAALAEEGEGEFTPTTRGLGAFFTGVEYDWSPATRLEMGPPVGARYWMLGLMLLAMASPAFAQQEESSAGVKFGRLLLGGAAGLGLHEAGHLVADWAFEEKVVVMRVGWKGVPFFALSHAADLSPRREYTVSSAGFWSQFLYSEQILTHHPGLRYQSSPFRKGLLTFHVVTSLVYAGAAFGKTGPVERDTRGMADSRRISERWIGALVLAPALLDTYRYFHPHASWAAWSSRGVKMGSVALVLK